MGVIRVEALPLALSDAFSALAWFALNVAML
jgi:hypothetical protein